MDIVSSKVLPQLNIQAVSSETFTSPLSNATPLIQRLRSSRPDIVIFYASNIPDIKLVVEKMSEFGLAGKIPVFIPTQAVTMPEVLQVIEPRLVEGLIGLTSNWPTSDMGSKIEEFASYSKEPWITADFLSPYGEVMLIRDAIERAAKLDTAAIAEQLRATPADSPAASYFAGDNFGFDNKGRRINGPAVLVQWQGGKPLSVYPENGAQAKLQIP